MKLRPEPIPRDTDGKVKVDEYRERLWFGQQAMLTYTNIALGGVMIVLGLVAYYHWGLFASGGVLAGLGGVLGILKKFIGA